MRTGRPKGTLQKPNWETWIIPQGVTPVLPLPDFFTKETVLEFNDATHGTFNATFKSFQRSKGLSTHPKAIEERRNKTNLERYGVSNAGSTKQAREKASNTMLKKYGVRNALESEVFLNKSKETLKRNFGVINPMQSETIKDKQKDTVMDRYGVSNIGMLDTEYYVFEGQTLKSYCAKNNVPYTTCYQIYKNYGKDIVEEWISSYTKKLSCLEVRFSKMFNEMSHYGKTVPNCGHFRPDFKFSDDLYVDVDGLLYHSDLKKQEFSYHKRKRETFEQGGKKILQFYQDEVILKPEIVKSIINTKMGICNNKIYGRDTEIRIVSKVDSEVFLSNNHLMGKSSGASPVGLYYNGELVCLITYKNMSPGVDIVRFCTKLNTIVIGGLSKLLSYIIKKESPLFIQSFVDLRYGNGESLTKLGFTLKDVHIGWKWTDCFKTFNRLACRANMDKRGLSESEHAKELGWHKIYDAGQAKFILNIG